MEHRGTQRHSRVPRILASARKEGRVLSPVEVTEIQADDPELLDDYRGTIDAVRTTHLAILRAEANVFSQRAAGRTTVRELVCHESFIRTCVHAFTQLGFSHEEARRVEGIGRFRALMDFVNGLTTEREREFAAAAAVRAENFIGPLSAADTADAKACGLPLVFVRGKCFTPYDPEKQTIWALVQAFHSAGRRITNQKRAQSTGVSTNLKLLRKAE
jgi:hypothetical protein